MSCLRLIRSTLLAAALGAAFAAHATPAASTVSFTGYNNGSVDIALAGPVGTTTRAGEFTGLLDGKSFTSYCIELTQFISVPSGAYTDYTRAASQDYTRFSAGQFDLFNRLYTNYLGDARLGAANSAGFQLAVWEIAYDGTNAGNLYAGSFRLGTNTGASAVDAIAHAQTYLTGLASKPTSSLAFEVLSSPSSQDQLVARVPVPGTAALALMGVFGMAATRRGKRAG